MNSNLFNIDNFNVLEDNDNYYLLRALNVADHNDFLNNLNNGNIRPDRERFEESYGTSKYSGDRDISLEEMFDHIKIHYSKETNCISLSTNANVSLDYGSNYNDEYVLVTIPKTNTKDYYYAGKYMLDEISKEVEKTLSEETIDKEIMHFIELIDRSNTNEDVVDIIKYFSLNYDNQKDIMSRFQDRQYFNSFQQLEYNKLVAKVTILELSGIRKSILNKLEDNSNLLGTINGAFSSGEVIHYNTINKENFIHISKSMVSLLAIAQQLKDKNIDGAVELERKIISLIKNGYNLEEKDGRIVLTNGNDTIDCNLDSSNSIIFKNIYLDENLIGIRELYNITSGSIDYQKAKKTMEFCYNLALGKREAYDYSYVIESILGNDSLTDSVVENAISVKSKFIDRGNKKGYKLCESVNIGMDSNTTSYYSVSEQRKFIDAIFGLDSNSLDNILSNNGLAFRNAMLKMLSKTNSISLEEFYARSIVEGIDYKQLVKMTFVKDKFSDEEKEQLIKDLSSCNISRLYEAFNKILDNKNDISYYIINLLLEGRYQGLDFKDLCDISNIDSFIRDNIHKLNKDINPNTLNRYFNIIDDCNYIPNSYINLRDYQLRIKEGVDDIYSDGRRFAGVVLPTGGGKSFVAMSEMLERKDSNIVYIAPRLEILRQFKKHIVKYVAGVDTNNLSDKEIDLIVKDCFPHLEMYCYQGLDKDDEEKLKRYDADFIILDELHHVGAEKWSPAVRALLERNKNSKVLGITATPIRDDVKGNNVEDADMMRAMAIMLDNYTTLELCEKRYLACDINIVDAIQEGFVVCPKIVSFDYDLENTDYYKNALQLVSREKNPTTKEFLNDKLSEMQDLISLAELRGVDTIIHDYLQDDKGRYILFIPRKPNEIKDDSGKVLSTDEYINSEIEKFKENLGLIDTDPVIDFIHSGRKKEDNSNAIRHFEADDNSDHIKILVAIDMLNEGVHLDGIKGSFNFRKIDSNHQILLLQHLGRTIFSIDPNKELEEKDIPVVFDKFNNYSNLNMDRMVNKTNSNSDLEKLKDIVFWINKYGYIPQTDSVNEKEKKKAITLNKIQKKYSKYIDADIDSLKLSLDEKNEIREILRIGKTINLWSIEFLPLTNEEMRKVDRVNIFNVSGVQKKFIDLYNSISNASSVDGQSKNVRINNVLAVLDYLSEYNIELSPNTIAQNTLLGKILDQLDELTREDVLYELSKRGINEEFLLGQEYYFARDEYSKPHGYFNNLDASVDNIINFRKYGILSNGSDYDFVNKDGFIMRGPKKFLSKNVWTGTYYSQDGYNIQGLDAYGFNYLGLYKETESHYDNHGFDVNHINKDTSDYYDKHEFDINGINKETHTNLNEYGFDIDGYYYEILENGNKIKTNRLYDLAGYNIDGVNRYGFDRNGINVDTGMKYDIMGFDQDGYYWAKVGSSRKKTDSKLNEQSFDRYGNLYESVDGKMVNKGKVYDNHGFYFNGIHYKTHTLYDERGFDIKGLWHPKNEFGEYEGPHTKFNDKGWNIDGLTIRHNVYGSEYDENDQLFLDYVDDHGFDEKGFYHLPVVGYDKNGQFSEEKLPFDQDRGYRFFYGGTIYHSKKARTGKNKEYDIHGFNYKGIHRLTGTKLNPNNFDIDGFYYIKNQDGVMINTGKMQDDRGFTIDMRRLDNSKYGYTYEKYNNKFDAEGRYINGGFYDKHGFNYNGIHYETGTILDTRNFDKNGLYYKLDEHGVLVNTNDIYDEDGWSQNETHISTGRIVDKHGFNFLHLYIGKNGKVDIYDDHGFDYTGIHKTTKTKLNRNNFDIDGYWYTEKDGLLVNSGSKYDEDGLDINRLDSNGFSKNGHFKGRRRKVNDDGFDVNGINIETNKPYDLEGKDINGNKVELSDNAKEKINYINQMKRKYKTVLIDDFYERLSDEDKRDILESYDVFSDEFVELDFIDSFIHDVKKYCSKDDYSDYSDEDILEFIKEKKIELSESDKNSELEEMYHEYYTQKHDDGDVPDIDYIDTNRYKNY